MLQSPESPLELQVSLQVNMHATCARWEPGSYNVFIR